MTYNNPNTKLDEVIYVAEKIIPADLCDAVIEDIETRQWRPHQWYNTQSNTSHSEETRELDIQAVTPELNQVLGNFIIEAGRMYNMNYTYLLVGVGLGGLGYYAYNNPNTLFPYIFNNTAIFVTRSLKYIKIQTCILSYCFIN